MSYHDEVRRAVSEVIANEPPVYETTTAHLECQIPYTRRAIGIALGRADEMPCGARVEKAGRHRWRFTR